MVLQCSFLPAALTRSGVSADTVGSAATSLEVHFHVQEGPDDDQWSPDTWEEDFFSHSVKAESDSCLHT